MKKTHKVTKQEREEIEREMHENPNLHIRTSVNPQHEYTR